MLSRRSSRSHFRQRPVLSLLVPFRDDGEDRSKTWAWLRRFWMTHLPEAEIVIGDDRDGRPFSKAEAVNDAAEQAHGQVFCVLDADCLMDPVVLMECTARIVRATSIDHRLWFVPYLRLFRLTKRASAAVLRSDPVLPYDIPSPPPSEWVHPHQDNGGHHYGHRFGAMVLLMPREAFFAVGGMDRRFRGWGGEDAAFMRALDTLWALHETTDNDTLHLWHEGPGNDFLTRQWVGQTQINVNARLAQRYGLANGDVTLMRALLDEIE